LAIRAARIPSASANSIATFVVALDLRSVYVTPEYEEHYYRAAAAEPGVEEQRALKWQRRTPSQESRSSAR